ncbi:MAG: aminopeptidase [Candidatus Shapirobacteria bacterium]|jgi:aminopeptidase
MTKYQPSVEILDRYADVLVNFALNHGKGMKKGEVVFLQVPESAKPLLVSLQKIVLRSGGHAIIQYLPDEIQKDFFALASDEQINFFPAKFLKGKIDQADHFLTILAETNLHELEGIDPYKIMDRNRSMKPYLDWRNVKEAKGKFSWTLGLYATPAMAKEAGISLKSCWKQIIRACYLDNHSPVNKWKKVQIEINRVKDKLNKLNIESLHIKSRNCDFTVGIDRNRKWLGGNGANIPSFELFISPDWRKTNGHIFFNQPLYRYGNLIKNINLDFKAGIVINATANYGQKVLTDLLKVENANKIGEFSLTDKRISKINSFMAETLYDENFGGRFGNTHIALGNSFRDSHPGNTSKITAKEWDDLGFNDSAIHVDLISSENRMVTATLENGTQIIIYKDGVFCI